MRNFWHFLTEAGNWVGNSGCYHSWPIYTSSISKFGMKRRFTTIGICPFMAMFQCMKKFLCRWDFNAKKNIYLLHLITFWLENFDDLTSHNLQDKSIRKTSIVRQREQNYTLFTKLMFIQKTLHNAGTEWPPPLHWLKWILPNKMSDPFGLPLKRVS